ncbi:MAG: hypothetical protein EOP48_24365 [Sphingobacteriales bacterium]|nr:MAG: hypothetical protein EOP48_24365 [Sphingobacteriales bacterium]
MDVHAIGAVGKKSDTKLTIGSYLDTYRKNQKRSRGVYYSNYYEYISTISKSMILEEGSSIVYDRIKGCVVHYIRSNSATEIDVKLFDDWIVKLAIGTISVNAASTIVSGGVINYEEVASYMNEVLQMLSEGIAPLVFQIPLTKPSEGGEDSVENNSGLFSGITVEFSTIHAVKGQTHDATILLSTQHGTLNAKSGSAPGTDVDYYVKKSTSLNRRKLTYVAASRPKYVFAWAIPNAKLDSLDQDTLNCFELIEV